MDLPDEDSFTSAFQARLLAVRKDLKWSRKKIADELGIKEPTYQKYETRPRSKFPLYLLPRLIVITDKSYSFWCFGTGDSKRHLRAV